MARSKLWSRPLPTRERFRRISIQMACTSALLAAASNDAHSTCNCIQPPQVKPYRMTPLKEIGFAPNVAANAAATTAGRQGTAGINNKGQVVYGYQTQASPELYKAWAWLPETDYGAGPGVIELSGQNENGIARDINSYGKAAGVSGSALEGSNAYATVWTIGSSVTNTTLSSSSWAFALTNASTPAVVGARIVAHTCDPIIQAFTWQPGGSASALSPASPQGKTLVRSIAIDVCPATCDDTVGLGHECDVATTCYDWAWGQHWTPNPTLLTASNIKPNAAGRDMLPYGINDGGDIVGWVAWSPTNSTNCFDTAVLLSGSSQIDLGERMPCNQGTYESRALAANINQAVVGYNKSQIRGIKWRYDSTQGCWVGEDLNDLIFNNCNNEWTIRQAHDINDSDWIVAYAERDISGEPPTQERWIVLLSPREGCRPEDVNNDGCVNTADYNEVVNHYGACPTAVICVWDVNGDCVVNSTDAFLVNASNCDLAEGETCCDCPSGLSGQGLEAVFAELIAIVLASNNSSEVQAVLIADLLNLYSQLVQ